MSFLYLHYRYYFISILVFLFSFHSITSAFLWLNVAFVASFYAHCIARFPFFLPVLPEKKRIRKYHIYICIIRKPCIVLLNNSSSHFHSLTGKKIILSPIHTATLDGMSSILLTLCWLECTETCIFPPRKKKNPTLYVNNNAKQQQNSMRI